MDIKALAAVVHNRPHGRYLLRLLAITLICAAIFTVHLGLHSAAARNFAEIKMPHYSEGVDEIYCSTNVESELRTLGYFIYSFFRESGCGDFYLFLSIHLVQVRNNL
jgi:hypothetical protein